MNSRSTLFTESAAAELLRHLADRFAEGREVSPREILSELGEQFELRSALWIRADGQIELAASLPADVPGAGALTEQVALWMEDLSQALARTELGGSTKLAESGRAQSIWPLKLEDSAKAIWVAESDDEVMPELAAAAEVVRVAVVLHRARQRLADRDVQLRDLKSAQELMGHIVDSLPLGLYVVDEDYRIVAWNRKREAGTQGVAREDAIGKSVFEVLYRQPQEQIRSELEEVFETDEIRHYEVDSTASGERRFYRLTKVPMHVSSGDAVSHVITVGEDITEQKRIADMIMHAEKLAALGQMAAGVMHEINNPLATITAGVDAVRECVADSTEEAELLGLIETEVERCKRIARDLLAFSRPPPSEKGPVDTQEAVEETLKLLQHHDRFKKIRVEREYVYDLPLVWANSERLVQVFVALALNALDAMEGDGELRVRTEILVEANELGISFIDTGCGIPQSELPKIFEPFYTSKAPGKGTGLGLSICYGIIREHGGRIEVDSAIGVGSNFRVVLPAYQETLDRQSTSRLGDRSDERE
jgi:two-component system NtrC family sensor kinase